jgi:hypothetical protein
MFSFRSVVRVVGVLALLAGVGAPPVGAGEIIEDPGSVTNLVVEPGDRTLPGVELTLTATVAKEGGPVVGEEVIFTMDREHLDTVVLDDTGRAQVRVKPPRGAHVLAVRYTGSGNLMGSSDQVVRSVLPAACPGQAVPGTGALVRHAYMVVTDACPDPTGFAYWTAGLDGGVAPTGMGRALARSAGGLGATVDRAYWKLFSRSPEAAGRAVWVAKLRAGWTTSQLWAALVASPEFIARHSGRDRIIALLDEAFRRLLGRPIDEGSRAYWYDRLSSGSSRSATLRALILTPEALGGVVRTTYEDVLGRSASPVEQTATQASIRARRGDWQQLAADLLGWAEASTFAQRYPG